ncbi:uncharacterized protein [Halyomorpha halys]
MTGYIPEYILPEDELTETEKTEGEYLDFPELKNAQDNVFVPPESEYSKNRLHYKNIKARKRLIPDNHRKIKLSGIQREILEPEIGPEELRSDLLANLVDNITGKDQKTNNSVKLDFLLPIPEMGAYPSINLNSDLPSSIESYSPTEQYRPRQTSYSGSISIQQGISRPTEFFRIRQTDRNNKGPPERWDSKQNERKNQEPNEHWDSRQNECKNSETTERWDSKQNEHKNTEPNDTCNPQQNEHKNLKTTERWDSKQNECKNPEPTEQCDPKENEHKNSEPTENCDPQENEHKNSEPTENCDPKQNENKYSESTEHCEPEQYESSTSKSIENCQSQLTERFNTEPTECRNVMLTEIGSSKVTQPCNSRSTEIYDFGQTEPMSDNRINQQWNIKFPNPQGSTIKFPTLHPQVLLEITNPQGPNNTFYPRGSMATLNPQGAMNIPNPQGSTKIPTLQWPMNISYQLGSTKLPSPKGPMITFSPLWYMKIIKPQGPIHIPNPSPWFMNTSDNKGSTNGNNWNKESTRYTSKAQYLFTIPEPSKTPNHPESKSNTTMSQPMTFEIIQPKSEKSKQMFQFTVALQSQPNITIKPALEQQIKSMLNIQLWPKQLFPQPIINTKQPENGLSSPVRNIKIEEEIASSSLVPERNRKIHALEQATIRTRVDNSSRRVDLKTIDKNIATNFVSLMADPSNMNKVEPEEVKAFIKPSFSLNSEMTRNAETYFDKESNNSSEIINPSNQNGKNKERKYINQSLVSNSTGKENSDIVKPKKKIFTFLNIFKKNKKYPQPDGPSQNHSTYMKTEIINNSPNELYRELLETNAMTDINYIENEYPIKLELEEEETFNHKRKKK